MKSTTTLTGILSFVLALAASASTLVAHPFHVCVGQMQWNETSKVWEVSLRVDPRDLESAMSLEFYPTPTDEKIGIGDENFPELATRYLNQHFFIRRTSSATTSSELDKLLSDEARSNPLSKPATPNNKEKNSDRSTVSWIGMEPEKGWLWLHFELSQPEADASQQKLWIVHRLLLDTVENQENSILIDPQRSPRFSLQFRSGAAAKELKKSTSVEKPVAAPSLDNK